MNENRSEVWVAKGSEVCFFHGGVSGSCTGEHLFISLLTWIHFVTCSPRSPPLPPFAIRRAILYFVLFLFYRPVSVVFFSTLTHFLSVDVLLSLREIPKTPIRVSALPGFHFITKLLWTEIWGQNVPIFLCWKKVFEGFCAQVRTSVDGPAP